MEEAHTESLTIKDDKIRSLELHLEETKNLNATLHRQLDTMQKEYQSYLDRYVRGSIMSTVSQNVDENDWQL